MGLNMISALNTGSNITKQTITSEPIDKWTLNRYAEPVCSGKTSHPFPNDLHPTQNQPAGMHNVNRACA